MDTITSLNHEFAYFLAKKYPYEPAVARENYIQFTHQYTKNIEEDIKEFRAQQDSIRKSMEETTKKGIKMVFCNEPDFPYELYSNRFPVMLFIKSKSDLKDIFNYDKYRMLAVVGTRDISEYGKEITKLVTLSVASNKNIHVIISGLAMGVDTVAHRTALENGIRTIAVLPTSLDRIYPACNNELANTIANTEGCALVSPFVPGTEPFANGILFRNQIIAGLSEDVYVTESRIKGGAIMTAKYAKSIGKNVYAVPGRITDERSSGCNDLIKRMNANIYIP